MYLGGSEKGLYVISYTIQYISLSRGTTYIVICYNRIYYVSNETVVVKFCSIILERVFSYFISILEPYCEFFIFLSKEIASVAASLFHHLNKVIVF